MKISSFTKSEIDYIITNANFTETELACFLLKAKGKTNVELSMKLNICDSTVSTTMKSVRAKVTAVLEEKASEKAKTVKHDAINADTLHPALNYLIDFLKSVLENTPLIPESHTIKEWAELPDKISIKDKLYVVTDYRTDDNSPSVPRFKFGDGVTMVSHLPFCTAAITDNDVRLWDLQMQVSQNTQKLKKNH